jgi:hypothetical protein
MGTTGGDRAKVAAAAEAAGVYAVVAPQMGKQARRRWGAGARLRLRRWRRGGCIDERGRVGGPVL